MSLLFYFQFYSCKKNLHFLRLLYFKGIHLHSAAQIQSLFFETITFLRVIQPLLQSEPATKEHTVFCSKFKVSRYSS